MYNKSKPFITTVDVHHVNSVRFKQRQMRFTYENLINRNFMFAFRVYTNLSR